MEKSKKSCTDVMKKRVKKLLPLTLRLPSDDTLPWLFEISHLYLPAYLSRALRIVNLFPAGDIV